MEGLISILTTWAIPIVAVVFFVSIYNKMVKLRNRFKNAFAQIDVQLQRRHDLIPNLVETAKAYMSHEAQTLEKVIAARNQASSVAKTAAADPANGAAVAKLARAEGILGGAMGSFFALSENYPDLKADSTMNDLMEQLSSTENRVAFARQGYNDAVMTYQTAIESFPNNVIAGFAGFKPAQMFEIEDISVKAVPKVKF